MVTSNKERATALPMARPKRVSQWTLRDVHTHLEYAVNLEMWTIPYYMTVMYSVEDTSDPAFRLVQSVVHQEMLHAELAANVYNSFQPARDLRIGPFQYTKEGGIPHLDFALDPEAVRKYGEPDARLGGLDRTRIGTMCLIELPESQPPLPGPDQTEYATIGDFYTALRSGMRQHEDSVRGNHRQTDHFGRFYRDLSHTTVTADRRHGLSQAMDLIDVITEQGEGRTNTDEVIPPPYRNTADGYDSSSSHFEKFNAIRDALLSGRAPRTYPLEPEGDGTDPREILAANFEALISTIRDIFNGRQPTHPLGVIMPTVGGNVRTCWRRGVVPQFSASVTRSMA
jgi:hypothetical protein